MEIVNFNFLFLMVREKQCVCSTERVNLT